MEQFVRFQGEELTGKEQRMKNVKGWDLLAA